MHIGSQILAVEPYRAAVEQVMELAAEVRRDGHELEYFDVGGGLGISYAGGEGITAAAFAETILPLVRPSGLSWSSSRVDTSSGRPGSWSRGCST
jgi:diaminopimelate decarboxylase